MLAAHEGNANKVATTNNDGRTALQMARAFGDEPVVTVLTGAGAVE